MKALFNKTFLLGVFAISAGYSSLTFAEDLSIEGRKSSLRHTLQASETLSSARVPPRAYVAQRFVYRSFPWGPQSSFVDIINTYPVGLTDYSTRQIIKHSSEIPSIAPFPKNFVMSDGSLFRPLLWVDRNPHSALSAGIEEVSRQILKLYGLKEKSDVWPETILQFLSNQTQDYISFDVQSAVTSAPISERAKQEERELMASLLDKSPGAYSAPFKHYTQDLERFENVLIRGKGVCLDMVLLASFILEDFKIPHRVIHGSLVAQHNPGEKGGHSWIELADGRILDVAWKTLGKVDESERHFYHKDWKFFGNSMGAQFRFSYEAYPILEILENR